MWLQQLLKAHSLVLYRIDKERSKWQLQLLGKYSVTDHAGCSDHVKMAMRCARKCAVLTAVSEIHAHHGVICIPALDSSRKVAEHVLVIERRKPFKLDPHTQTTLVSWAFASLGNYIADPEPTSQTNSLAQWCLAESHQADTIPVVFAQLMDQLQSIADADRCLVAKLSVNGHLFTGAGLIAVSGQRKIDSRLPAAESLVLAIEDCYRAQRAPFALSLQTHAQPSLAMQAFVSAAQQTCTRLIIPVYCLEQWYAISIERTEKRPFSKTEQSRLERDACLALQLLLLSDPHERGVAAAVKRKCYAGLRRIGASVPRTVVAMFLCAAGLLYLLVPVEHRVSADLNVEASEKHVLIAPVDGFVKSVAVKAGERVVKGQVLAALDDVDLQLQMKKLESQIRQNQQAYAKALAFHDRIEVTRLKEEVAVVETELSQLELQRARMVLVAPVDGVVLSGSWDDFLGAAVSMGDTLFTLGSESSHRLVLDVSEFDVKSVEPGQSIGIRMSADPSKVLRGAVFAVMPLAVAEAGENKVKVHAALNHPAQLRPGMQGLGKILIGKASRLSQWTHRLTSRIVWLGWRLGVLT